MDSDELKSAVVEWANKIGAVNAHLRLVRRNISPSTAEKLIGNRYPAELRKKTRQILIKELVKDGFVLGKAS